MLFNNSKNIYLFIVIATFLSGQSKYQEVDKIRDELQLFDPAYQGSIKLPYTKTFNNFNPLMKENDEFGIEFFDNKYGDNYWIDKIENNRVLALQVFPKDVASMGNCASDKNCPGLDTLSCCSYRDRCEAKIYPHHVDGNYFYEWKFMIPNDFKFQSFNINGSKTRHFIAQWHQSYNYESTRRNLQTKNIRVKWKYNQLVDCEGRRVKLKGKPPVTFNLIHDDDNMDKRLDLVISYGTQYNYHWLKNCIPDTNSIIGGRQYRIRDIVAPGEWVKIKTEINWSSNSSDGYMKIWINDQPYQIIMDDGVRILKRNNGGPSSKLIGANLYIDQYEFPQPNYLKLGHYRSNMSIPHLIFVDDIKITEGFIQQ